MKKSAKKIARQITSIMNHLLLCFYSYIYVSGPKSKDPEFGLYSIPAGGLTWQATETVCTKKTPCQTIPRQLLPGCRYSDCQYTWLGSDILVHACEKHTSHKGLFPFSVKLVIIIKPYTPPSPLFCANRLKLLNFQIKFQKLFFDCTSGLLNLINPQVLRLRTPAAFDVPVQCRRTYSFKAIGPIAFCKPARELYKMNTAIVLQRHKKLAEKTNNTNRWN